MKISQPSSISPRHHLRPHPIRRKRSKGKQRRRKNDCLATTEKMALDGMSFDCFLFWFRLLSPLLLLFLLLLRLLLLLRPMSSFPATTFSIATVHGWETLGNARPAYWMEWEHESGPEAAEDGSSNHPTHSNTKRTEHGVMTDHSSLCWYTGCVRGGPSRVSS